MMEMSRQYFGVDDNDLRDKHMTMRMLFNKVYENMKSMVDDEERQREFEGMYTHDHDSREFVRVC